MKEIIINIIGIIIFLAIFSYLFISISNDKPIENYEPDYWTNFPR